MTSPGQGTKASGPQQLSLFERPRGSPTPRQAIEFCSHKRKWSNRLIGGDPPPATNSLLKKEGMAGKLQMIYIDLLRLRAQPSGKTVKMRRH